MQPPVFDLKTKSLLAYCDYIAHLISKNLKKSDYQFLLSEVGKVDWGLSEDGSLQTTTKSILVTDRNGKAYKITVEEVM